MIRIGICDDIYDARMLLHTALEQIFESRGLQNTFVEFPSRILRGCAGLSDETSKTLPA